MQKIETLEEPQKIVAVSDTIANELETQYPFHNRRSEGFELIDMIGKVSTKKMMSYPYGKVPVYKKDWSVSESKLKYSGAKLRQLRAERGVGVNKK